MTEDKVQLEIAGCTHKGLLRSGNEDHLGFNEQCGLSVLADGMGGHQAGEVAARMAVTSTLEKLRNLLNEESSVSITGSQLLANVSNTISDSNTEIYEAAEANRAHKGMGTTLVAAIVKDAQIYTGHVGDSRIYLYREGTLRRLSSDHSLVQDLIDKGFYTEVEARKANVSHVVTRALGTRSEIEVDTMRFDFEAEDLVLLCSDGLTDMVPDNRIEQQLGKMSKDLNTAAKELVDLANEFGGKDNISVILMRASSNHPASSETIYK